MAQQSPNRHQYTLKPSYDSSAYSRHSQGQGGKLDDELKTNEVDDVIEDELSVMVFHGFLTIGTLGAAQPVASEPPTPSFPSPYEDMAHRETDMTENELRLINDELGKLLEAEDKEVYDETSARSSYVSAITLGGKGVDTEDYGAMAVCPLQEYLFGSSIELPKTRREGEKERTSLGQLLKGTNTACEHPTEKLERRENQTKGTHAIHFMKKMLKKLHPTSRVCAAAAYGGGGVAGSAVVASSSSTRKKLSKVEFLWY